MSELIINTAASVLAGIICQLIFYAVVVVKREAKLTDRDILERSALIAFSGVRALAGLFASLVFSLYFSLYLAAYALVALFKLNLWPVPDSALGGIFVAVCIVQVLYMNYRILIDTRYLGLRDILKNYAAAAGMMLVISVVYGGYLWTQSSHRFEPYNHQYATGLWVAFTLGIYYPAVISEEEL